MTWAPAFPIVLEVAWFMLFAAQLFKTGFADEGTSARPLAEFFYEGVDVLEDAWGYGDGSEIRFRRLLARALLNQIRNIYVNYI